jgi:endonuclease/exonuclease/phosphatase family metal-dependent hydrolase
MTNPSAFTLSLLLTLPVVVSAGACGPETDAGALPALRVMTYNIAAGHGDLTRIAETICSAEADVVGLQEVDVHWGERSAFADQASELAVRCGMDFRFGPIYTFPSPEPGATSRQYGVAVLSRHPITEWENHPLTRLSTQAETGPEPLPGFLEVTVDVGGTPVHVFDTHLDYRPDAAVRRAQVAEMLAVIGATDRPTILVGDMNAPPEREELAPLFRRFRDAWGEGPDPGHTYPGDEPVRRIDYVFYSGPLRVVSARVVASDASDHRPVVVDFAVGGR